MKKKLLYLTSLLSVIAIVTTFSLKTHSNPNGAPAGVTGSPGDGQTCFRSGCHFGAPAEQAGMISSDIPSCGYTPGATYTITATISGNSPKGFQVSPQDANGNPLGSITAGSNNYTLQNGKYVTHTAAISAQAATWTFTWTAPAAGSGQVTFYGAFANGRNTTKTSTLSVSECTVGFEELEAIQNLSVFPTPANSTMKVSFGTKTSGPVVISVFNMSGQKVSTILNENRTAGNQVVEFDGIQTQLKSGVYFLQVNASNFQKVVKFVVE